ncbi:hypothetical protein FNF07_21560 [Trinickia caryophylli]|nr:hypothetical protein [Trinickia caryophylli]PMS11975.1 hypothetical protein C0Z17_12355 [Trinickia caryophylli]TRX13946.1 hypothetical protein FNF07_21560 [Trinickia caryophylli]
MEEQRYFPGQTQLCSVARATCILAPNGPLKLRYRDRSLSSLDAAFEIVVDLYEGERYVMPCAAWVAISAMGSAPVRAVFIRPPAWPLRVAHVASRLRASVMAALAGGNMSARSHTPRNRP